MATLQQPSIEFTNQNQNRVKVSFKVKFTDTELGGGVSSSWKSRYIDLFKPTLPPLYSYSAQVLFKVIRIVPQPFVRGTPPPPLPDPVILQVANLNVALPSSGNTKSLNTEFTYTFAGNDPLVFDHLHAEIRLFRRLRLAPNLFSFPIDTKTTNDLVLTVGDLASPQPNGVVIP
jgi:hypothetical protein